MAHSANYSYSAESTPLSLAPLDTDTWDLFIQKNQEAFNYGALVEFGERNTDFEEDGQIISRASIEASLHKGQGFWILAGRRPVGGLVVQIEQGQGSLDLLFIDPEEHSKGYGQKAWDLVENAYPEVTRWELFTPYFETRNVYFYINKLGFEIEKFFNKYLPAPKKPPHEAAASEAQNQPTNGETQRHTDAFLFVKNMALHSTDPSAAQENPPSSQRVEYSDKELLHQLINLQGMRAVHYERNSEGMQWLHLQK